MFYVKLGGGFCPHDTALRSFEEFDPPDRSDERLTNRRSDLYTWQNTTTSIAHTGDDIRVLSMDGQYILGCIPGSCELSPV